METVFPFFSIHPDHADSVIYHTHPRCRVAQQVPVEARVLGTGESRTECPFCFLLAQFQANRDLRGHLPASAPPAPGAASADAAARLPRAPTLHH